MVNRKISLIIKTREATLYQGEVRALTSHNAVGQFDILPEHANFISLIEKAIIVHELSGKKREIRFDVALLKIVQNKVEIYLGVKSLAVPSR